MDSRQNLSSLMGPPGYPHMPPMSNTAPTMTGDSPIALLTGQEEPGEIHGVYRGLHRGSVCVCLCVSKREIEIFGNSTL